MKKTKRKIACALSILFSLSGCGKSSTPQPTSISISFDSLDTSFYQSRKQEVYELIQKENITLNYDDLTVSNQEINFSILDNSKVDYTIRLDELGTYSNVRFFDYIYTLYDSQQEYEVTLSYLDYKGNVASGTIHNQQQSFQTEFYYGEAISNESEEHDFAELDDPIIDGEDKLATLNPQLEEILKESIEEKKKELSDVIQAQATLIRSLESVLETRRNEVNNYSYRSTDLEATFQTGGWVKREDGLYQTKTETGLKLYDLTLQKVLWNDSKSQQYNWFSWESRTGEIQGCSFDLIEKTTKGNCNQDIFNQLSTIQQEVAYQFDPTLKEQQVTSQDPKINQCLQEVAMTLSQRVK